MTYNIQERCEHYNTTVDSCDCPARLYNPTRVCKHMEFIIMNEPLLSFDDESIPLVRSSVIHPQEQHITITIPTTPPPLTRNTTIPPSPPRLHRSVAISWVVPPNSNAILTWEQERSIDALYWECDGCGNFRIDCTCHNNRRKRPRLEEPSEESFKKMKKEQCTICLEQHDKTTSCKTQCGHYFHKDCITKWAKRSFSCPLCRTQLTPVQ